MDDIDVNGIFWDSAAPEHMVAGRLTFSQRDGALLELTGAFDLLPNVAGEPGTKVPARQIHGLAGDAEYSLLGCGEAQYQYRFPGLFQTQTFFAQAILRGGHLDPSHFGSMSSVSIMLKHLPQWVDYNGISDEHIHDDTTGALKEYRLEYRPLPAQTARTDYGTLSLNPRWKTSGIPIFGKQIEHSCALTLEPSLPCRIEDLVLTARTIRDLLSLAINAPAEIESVYVQNENYTEPRGQDNDEPLSFELIRQWAPSFVNYPTQHIESRDILFSLSDIGGLEGLGEWLAIAETYSVVIQSLTALHFIPQDFTDARLLTAAAAADALARIHSKGEMRYYHDRLAHLQDLAGDVFVDLVHDCDVWRNVTVELRNNVAHGDSKEEHSTHRPLTEHITASLYYLVLLCLLRIARVPDEAISDAREQRHFADLSRLFRHLMGDRKG